jgi:fucose permease
MASLGALLPAWEYHLKSEYLEIGNHFLGINVGLFASAYANSSLLSRKGIRFKLVLGCILGAAAFVSLAVVPPGAHAVWRVSAMVLIGLAAGLLNASVFRAISHLYLVDPAATVNLAGVFFGLGCLVTSLLVAGTFYVYNVPSILLLLALFPACFAGLYARSGYEEPPPPKQPSFRETLEDFKSPGALMFSLLLFIQFGNEWCIAGWLALFLIQRLGISPASSLMVLSLYWLSLMVGRAGVQWLLPRVRHGKLLMVSGVSAVFGCAILLSTNNLFGAHVGVLLVGGGFAAVYPLVVEKIGDRFPYYHPGFYNGIFSLALTGGFLAPWTMGIYAHWWGIRGVMLLPLVGACAVFLLLLLIWLYARLTAAPSVSADTK